MSENELDSSKINYDEYSVNDKKNQWDMAIGLQKVDNLKPSKYLEKLINENIEGKKTIYEVEEELKSYYTDKEKEINKEELECDFVSSRIVELLQQDRFELSVDYLKEIHGYLFKDIYEFAGQFRKVNISKKERILNDESVMYGNYNSLEDSISYDISLEKDKDYSKMSMVEIIKSISDFSSSIWQVHPFREGNTRTTAVFIQKYLISLGYDVDNSLFKSKSVYYRNALVRANYHNDELNLIEDKIYLSKFYENLLLGKNNSLHSKDIIVKELY